MRDPAESVSGTVTTDSVVAEPRRATFPAAAGAGHLLKLGLALRVTLEVWLERREHYVITAYVPVKPISQQMSSAGKKCNNVIIMA